MSDKKVIKFNNVNELKKYIQERAETIVNAGEPVKDGNKLMNTKDELKQSDGSYVKSKPGGGFETKKEGPTGTPDEFTDEGDPIDQKMNQKDSDQGHDESVATAAKIEGSKSTKSGEKTNPYIAGQHKPDVTTKTTQPNVTTDNDPTKEGGVPGGKDNDATMNQEDGEDKQTTPKTQVIGKGEMGKEGFSKGQTDKEINAKAKQENDSDKEKLDAQIKTVQLPESFKTQSDLDSFINENATRIAKELLK